MTQQQKWDNRFMGIAKQIATWSKDRSTQVGCLIVGPLRDIVATGYNGFPRQIDDGVDARHGRPEKYFWTEHAERNAIYAAARLGHPLEGCTIYVPWFPCADCSRAIIQAGITTMVAYQPDFGDERWGADFKRAEAMLVEAGIRLRYPQPNEVTAAHV